MTGEDLTRSWLGHLVPPELLPDITLSCAPREGLTLPWNPGEPLEHAPPLPASLPPETCPWRPASRPWTEPRSRCPLSPGGQMGPAHQLNGLGGAPGSWLHFPVSCSRSMGVTCPIHLPLPSGDSPSGSLVTSCVNSPLPRQLLSGRPGAGVLQSRTQPSGHIVPFSGTRVGGSGSPGTRDSDRPLLWALARQACSWAKGARLEWGSTLGPGERWALGRRAASKAGPCPTRAPVLRATAAGPQTGRHV